HGEQQEAWLPHRENVGAAVRELLGRADQRHAPEVTGTRRRVVVRRARRRDVGDAEPPVGRETIGEELAVARLENVQGLRRPWKEDNRQREDWEFASHA